MKKQFVLSHKKKFQRKTQKKGREKWGVEQKSHIKKESMKKVKDACFLKTSGWFVFACLDYYANNKVYIYT